MAPLCFSGRWVPARRLEQLQTNYYRFFFGVKIFQGLSDYLKGEYGMFCSRGRGSAVFACGVTGVILGLGLLVFVPVILAANSQPFQKISAEKDLLIGTVEYFEGAQPEGLLKVERTMPRRVQVGKPFTYTVTVTNRGACPLDDVLVVEKLHEKLEIVRVVPETVKASGKSIDWKVGGLAPKETKVLTITGMTREMQAIPSCTKATYRPLLCFGPEVVPSDLKVLLKLPPEVLLCDRIPLKVTVTNSRSEPLQNVKLTPILPDGIKTFNEDKNSGAVEVGLLAAKASRNFDLVLKATKVGSYILKMDATAGGEMGIASEAKTLIVKSPDLKVKAGGPEKIPVTKDAVYDVEVQNIGNAKASGVFVTAALPTGMTYVSAGNGGVFKDGAISWNVGTLDIQKAVTLNVTYRGATPGSSKMEVKAKGACCQEVSAAVKTEIQGSPALLLDSSVEQNPITVGNIEKFRVTVTNQGTAEDRNIVLKINFEKNFDYVSASGPTQAKAESAKAVEFAPLASLAPQQKATWEIKAKAVEEGDHRFGISVKSDAIERPIAKTDSTRVFQP